ncbi:hypothetical protein [Oceanobacillus sp. CAU 1775]
MNGLLWFTLAFIIIGFATLVSMKKTMERKLAFIKEDTTYDIEASKPILWWIAGCTLWGVVSIFLVVWNFSVGG